MKVAAIVPAAGKGKRLGSNIEKPYIKLANKPILAHTLIKLSKNRHISEVLVAVARDKIGYARKNIIDRYNIKKARLVVGGEERRDSVYNALKVVSSDVDYILIHDGIRPFITDELVEHSLSVAKRYGASVLAVPAKPTLKLAGKNGFIEFTPDRRGYWEAQTPQVFRKDLIEKAYKDAIQKDIQATDDSMLAEMVGIKPKLVMGSYSNIKITTREDIELAKILIKSHHVTKTPCHHDAW